jgi:hypothetical protein
MGTGGYDRAITDHEGMYGCITTTEFALNGARYYISQLKDVAGGAYDVSVRRVKSYRKATVQIAWNRFTRPRSFVQIDQTNSTIASERQQSVRVSPNHPVNPLRVAYGDLL